MTMMMTLAAAAAVAAAISATRNLKWVTTSTAFVAALACAAASAGPPPAAAAHPAAEAEQAARAAGRLGIRVCSPRAVTLASSFRGRAQRPACPSLCGNNVATRQCVARGVGGGRERMVRTVWRGQRFLVPLVRWTVHWTRMYAGLVSGTSRLTPLHPTSPHSMPSAVPHTNQASNRGTDCSVHNTDTHRHTHTRHT